jgi:hypothetical protein
MNATRIGIPAIPDPNGDEKIFRLRTIELIRELYRRVDAVQAAVESGAADRERLTRQQ